MREILYKQRQTHTEDGQPLQLSYFILMNKGTDRSERAFDLLDKLARNTVTPTGLPDVLADWRG